MIRRVSSAFLKKITIIGLHVVAIQIFERRIRDFPALSINHKIIRARGRDDFTQNTYLRRERHTSKDPNPMGWKIQRHTFRDLLVRVKIAPLNGTAMRILEGQPIPLPQFEDPIQERGVTLIQILEGRKGNIPRST
jgi:hypothetical protein